MGTDSKGKSGVEEWLNFFENVGRVYVKWYLEPYWKEKYKNHEKDLTESLMLFLDYYAFERQGADPSYCEVAIEVIKEHKRDLKNGVSRKEVNKIANKIWRTFIEKLEKIKEKNGNNQGRIGLNCKVNPICPTNCFKKEDDCPYSKNDKDEEIENLPCKKAKDDVETSISVTEFVLYNVLKEHSTLTTYFKQKIEENKEKGISQAHKELTKIRGIGDKIASFYLRDLVVATGIKLDDKTEYRYLLQPVDIWVRRTADLLISKFQYIPKSMPQQRMSEENRLKTWIVYASKEYRAEPELVNMGMWFFGSHVALSEYKLHKVINDGVNEAMKQMSSFLEDFKKNVHNAYLSWRKISSSQ